MRTEKVDKLSPEGIRERIKSNSNFLPNISQVIRVVNTWEDWDNLFNPEGGRTICEVWTEEYVDQFTDYLEERIIEIVDHKENKNYSFQILEVGAGPRSLGTYIEDKLKNKTNLNVNVVVTDKSPDKNSQVEQLDVRDLTASKYDPDIVISSWPPSSSVSDSMPEFSCHIRKLGPEEYILIGDPAKCGNKWKTWGDLKKVDVEEEPPYRDDGYKKVELGFLRKFQVSRSDSFSKFADPEDEKKWMSDSKTVSFRK